MHTHAHAHTKSTIASAVQLLAHRHTLHTYAHIAKTSPPVLRIITHTHRHTHTETQIQTRTYTHTHTHTYTHTQSAN